MEIWKYIDGYNNLYQVSDLGRVKSFSKQTPTILRPGKTNGYLTVSLHGGGKAKTYLVHQLVAIGFLNHNPSGNKMVVDHIDENRTNNNLSNLRVITQKENLLRNRKLPKHGFRGVSHDKKSDNYNAYIRTKDQHSPKFLGTFPTPILASMAYEYHSRKIERGC